MAGDCTYQIAPAGEIRIDDLVGITEETCQLWPFVFPTHIRKVEETGNYANFIKVGGRETQLQSAAGFKGVSRA